jgi:hypothetical protein
VGKKKSSFSQAKFSTFQGHYLMTERTRRFSMKGANAEVGAHINTFKKAPLYFAAGPYYLTGTGATAWGGEFRAGVDLFDRYLRIEGDTSYDHFFKWTGQAQVSVNIPFGGRRKIAMTANRSCNNAIDLRTRLVQPVDRIEIIPEGKQKQISPGINPTTGKPWFFIFVDNESHSAGTYESPYPTLLEAETASLENQIIYVFPGDGTTNGMSDGITLKNGQMLLGASIAYPFSTTVGTIVVPPLAVSRPKITNVAGNVVNLANNNTVTGFDVTVIASRGISGTTISNALLDQNSFVTTIGNTTGIYMDNPSGTITASNSAFNGFFDNLNAKSGNGIYVESAVGSTLDNLNILKNSFSNITGNGQLYSGNGFTLLLDGGAMTNLNVLNNQFSAIKIVGDGTHLRFNSGTLTNCNISGNSFDTIDDRGFSGIFNGAAVENITVTDNAFTGITGGALGCNIFLGNGTLNNFTVSNNLFTIADSSSNCILYDSQHFTFNVNAVISNNTFIGTGTIADQFAARIRTVLGTICLNFIHNQATPVSSPTPYRFIIGGGGTFKLTPCNYDAVNTGTFSLSGVTLVQSCPTAVACP